MAKRLPSALSVFPTLQRFPLINPRHIPSVPVGCTHKSINKEDVQRSLDHLYHDLGVLVFAGCSVAQTGRIGDILRDAVRLEKTRMGGSAAEGLSGLLKRDGEGEVVGRLLGPLWELEREVWVKRAEALAEETKL